MIVTGVAVLVFLAFHLANFKYGTYYTTTVDGVQMRDLARLVVEKFRSPVYTFSYVSAIVLLGFHLRHGVWSSLQSLGLIDAAVKNTVYFGALIIAVLISTAFVVLPLSIYFGWY
jgi:succinate dehydrogenase / fumarate reductase cytochrome b subunit